MSEVLVIGASGFIGQHVVRQLRDQYSKVYATCLVGETLPLIDGVVWVECDLTQPRCIEMWPKRCDSVVYLAQSPMWRDFPSGAANVFDVNVAAVFRTAEYARRAGAKRLIFASTGSIYTQTERPAREDDPVFLHKVSRFYDVSKLAAELLLGPFRHEFAVVILRIFLPYGPGQNPEMLLPRLVQRVRDGVPITLHGQDGMIVNPVFVVDVAEAFARCVALDESVTLNLAGKEVLTLRQIGERIGEMLGKSPVFVSLPEQPVPMVVGDIALMKRYLQWSPKISFETGLRVWLGESEMR